MRCTYCGDFANSLDHVIPYSSGSVKAKKRNTNRKTCVPCCRECNDLLHNLYLLTVGTRAAYLANKYPKRYAKLLTFPDWSDEEMIELGYNMCNIIESGLQARNEIKRRIKYCQLISMISPSIEEVWKEQDKLEEDNEEAEV